MIEQSDRPPIVDDKHLTYLDGLRASGITNMFGASPYLTRAFKLTSPQAREVLLYWMQSFEKRHKQ